ncbi:MAG: hypothetical protein NVSMB6_33080 [Burkholderiaceae bacterium]
MLACPNVVDPLNVTVGTDTLGTGLLDGGPPTALGEPEAAPGTLFELLECSELPQPTANTAAAANGTIVRDTSANRTTKE